MSLTILSATLTAEDISARIGLKPDDSWRAGASRGMFGVKAKENGFVLESAVAPHASLDEHLKVMLQRIATCAQLIGALGADIELACSLQRRVFPPLRFERDDLRWLAVMGARLTIDTLILSEPGAKAGAKPGAPGAPGTPGTSGMP